MPEGNCCAPKLALSVEEEAILRRMRRLREAYRALAVEDPSRDELRREFSACRAELAQANRDKWIRLGYEP